MKRIPAKLAKYIEYSDWVNNHKKYMTKAYPLLAQREPEIFNALISVLASTNPNPKRLILNVMSMLEQLVDEYEYDEFSVNEMLETK